uniref:Mcm10 domain-containing protein n=1 Tax=Macrostomum lignano TaxID=282301 RepID=A0A1I8FJX6_9PLAT
SFNAALSERNVDKAQRLAGGARQLPAVQPARLRRTRRRRDLPPVAPCLRRACWLSLTLQAGDSRSCGPLRLVMPRTACIADLKDARRCADPYLVTSNPEHWPPKKDHLEQLKAAVRAERDRQVIRPEDSTNTMKALQDLRAGAVPSAPSATSRCGPAARCAVGARPPDYEVPAELQAEEEQRQLKLHGEFLKFTSGSAESASNFRELMNLTAGLADPRAGAAGLRVPDLPLRRLALAATMTTATASGACGCASAATRSAENCLRDHAAQTPTGCPSSARASRASRLSPRPSSEELLTDEQLARLQRLGLRQAEAVITKRLPLRDAKLRGIRVARSTNCVTCRASHKDLTCQQYQDDLRRRAENDENAKLGLQKLEAATWLMCSVCRRTENLLGHPRPRWDRRPEGDTSGGCRCR